MYGCESDPKEGWVLKNGWFWTTVLKILESPLNHREIKPVNPKGNQLWIFTGRTDAEVEVPIFGHLIQRTDSLEKTLMLGKIEVRRRKGRQRMRQLYGITDSMNMIWVSSGSWWWTGKPGMLQSMGSERVRHNWASELTTSHSKVHSRQVYNMCWTFIPLLLKHFIPTLPQMYKNKIYL